MLRYCLPPKGDKRYYAYRLRQGVDSLSIYDNLFCLVPRFLIQNNLSFEQRCPNFLNYCLLRCILFSSFAYILDQVLEKHPCSTCPHHAFCFYVVVNYSSKLGSWIDFPQTTTCSMPFPPWVLISTVLLTSINNLYSQPWTGLFAHLLPSGRFPLEIPEITNSAYHHLKIDPLSFHFLSYLIVPSTHPTTNGKQIQQKKLDDILNSLFFLCQHPINHQSILIIYYFKATLAMSLLPYVS